MKKIAFFAIVVLLFQGCKKSDPNPVDNFVGVWVRSQTLNDATFKGDAKYLVTIKKTSETQVSAAYEYNFSGTYGTYPATQTSTGSYGLLNLSDNTLLSENVLYNISTTLIYQKSGSPVTLKDNYSYTFSTLQFVLVGQELQIKETPKGGTTNTTTFKKQ